MIHHFLNLRLLGHLKDIADLVNYILFYADLFKISPDSLRDNSTCRHDPMYIMIIRKLKYPDKNSYHFLN